IAWGGHAMVRTLEQSTMRKVYLRLLPFAILTYFFCYLDRINVGFAALTMNKDLGLDASMFGMAAGGFFWGYCLFEVPSNMIMGKVGARNLDRAHHDHLGDSLWRDRALHRPLQLHGRALPARRRRGRVLPGHRAVLHLLVPGSAPRPHRVGIHAGAADRGRTR